MRDQMVNIVAVVDYLDITTYPKLTLLHAEQTRSLAQGAKTLQPNVNIVIIITTYEMAYSLTAA
jgi:hypothetical protein